MYCNFVIQNNKISIIKINLIARRYLSFAIVTNLIKYFDLFYVFVVAIIRLSTTIYHLFEERKQKRAIKIKKLTINFSIHAQLIKNSIDCFIIIILLLFL